jgi:ribosome recycling factor
MPTKAILKQHETSMQKAVEFLDSELKGLRTGRATTGLVENLRVMYYGNLTPLKQIASISTPDATSLIIKPFDPAAIKDIEKAIKVSDLGMTPMVDGQMIRLPVPPLSGERRKQIANQVKQMAEQAKIALRNIRRDANKHLDDEEKAKMFSEDERDKAKKIIDDLTKKYTAQIDEHAKQKTDDIMKS